MAGVFSLKEVATHNSNKSTWIVIHNNVSLTIRLNLRFPIARLAKQTQGQVRTDDSHILRYRRFLFNKQLLSPISCFPGVRCYRIPERGKYCGILKSLSLFARRSCHKYFRIQFRERRHNGQRSRSF